jgi:hypothetical protein
MAFIPRGASASEHRCHGSAEPPHDRTPRPWPAFRLGPVRWTRSAPLLGTLGQGIESLPPWFASRSSVPFGQLPFQPNECVGVPRPVRISLDIFEKALSLCGSASRFAYERRPTIAYSRVGTARTLSAVPSSSNLPASHLGSEFDHSRSSSAISTMSTSSCSMATSSPSDRASPPNT